MPAEWAEDGVSPAEQGRAERRPAGSFRSLFPALGDVRPEYVYGGAIGVTRDLLPRIGLLSPRISYAYGYCGHGIVSAHIAAKALRDLTLETGRDTLDLPFVVSSEGSLPDIEAAAGLRCWS
jgi:glycine/D-amino acid oxidase-like deaminating enzyme